MLHRQMNDLYKVIYKVKFHAGLCMEMEHVN